MWGESLRWRPWPTPVAPQLELLGHQRRRAPEAPVCALMGRDGDPGLGRYGLFAMPRSVRPLAPGPGTIAAAVDGRPAGILRLAFFGYELGTAEVSLPERPSPPGQPPGLVCDCDAAIVVDHAERCWAPWGEPEWIPVAAPPGESSNSEIIVNYPLVTDHQRADRAPDRGSDQAPVGGSGSASEPTAGSLLVPLVSDGEHLRRIAAIREHIAAGDIYQANLSRRLRLGLDPDHFDPLALLAALQSESSVAHGAYLRAGGFELLSNSMETLLTYAPGDRRATSFPIKGTARRTDDREAAPELAAIPKERAEHIMIVDLVRNDLGRVCTPGSVAVAELMGTYGSRGVWHGISQVTGTLGPRHTPGELLAALFPGGSITGAPKRRAMQLIADLENEPRGAYTGSLALIGPDGSLSTSILIRTLVRDADGYSLAVGGGIVADSDPERELDETWAKAGAMARALERLRA